MINPNIASATPFLPTFEHQHSPVWQRILEDSDFVRDVISGLDDLVKKNLSLSGQQIDIAALARQVRRKYNISLDELCSGSRR